MPAKQEDLVLDVCVPDKGLMIKSSGKQTLVHLRPVAPGKRVHALIMSSQLLLELMGRAVPETDVPAETSRDQGLLGIDGQDIADRTGVSFLLRVGLVERIPSRNSPSFLQRARIVDVYNRI